MQRELEKLRRAIARTAINANGRRRFDAALRAQVCGHARRRVDAGERLAEIAGSLGLHPRSLWGWLQADAPIREVELVDDVGVAASHEGAAGTHGLRLILRGGAEVVGLQLHEVIALVRALS